MITTSSESLPQRPFVQVTADTTRGAARQPSEAQFGVLGGSLVAVFVTGMSGQTFTRDLEGQVVGRMLTEIRLVDDCSQVALALYCMESNIISRVIDRARSQIQDPFDYGPNVALSYCWLLTILLRYAPSFEQPSRNGTPANICSQTFRFFEWVNLRGSFRW